MGCGRLSCGWFALLTHAHLLCIAADYGSSPHDPDVSTGGAAWGHFLAGCAWLRGSCFWQDYGSSPHDPDVNTIGRSWKRKGPLLESGAVA